MGSQSSGGGDSDGMSSAVREGIWELRGLRLCFAVSLCACVLYAFIAPHFSLPNTFPPLQAGSGGVEDDAADFSRLKRYKKALKLLNGRRARAAINNLQVGGQAGELGS